MINKPPLLKGLNIRILIIIPIKGRGLLITGLGQQGPDCEGLPMCIVTLRRPHVQQHNHQQFARQVVGIGNGLRKGGEWITWTVVESCRKATSIRIPYLLTHPKIVPKPLTLNPSAATAPRLFLNPKPSCGQHTMSKYGLFPK